MTYSCVRESSQCPRMLRTVFHQDAPPFMGSAIYRYFWEKRLVLTSCSLIHFPCSFGPIDLISHIDSIAFAQVFSNNNIYLLLLNDSLLPGYSALIFFQDNSLCSMIHCLCMVVAQQLQPVSFAKVLFFMIALTWVSIWPWAIVSMHGDVQRSCLINMSLLQNATE